MAQKKLQKGSMIDSYDLNKDNEITNIINPLDPKNYHQSLSSYLEQLESLLKDYLDYNDLVSLNVHLPSLFINDKSQFYRDFLINYYSKYFSYPENYAYTAYMQCMYFLSKEFKTLFNFKKAPNTSFKSNTKFNIYRYDKFDRIKVQ